MNFKGFSDEIEIRAVSKPNKNVEELFRAYNIKMEEERASDSEELDITVPIIEMQCEDSDEQNNSSNYVNTKSEENNKFHETASSIINGDEEGTLVSIQVGTPKLQRTVLSLEKKVKVLEEREKGFSERKLAGLFKCSKTQISNVLKNKKSIINDWIENKHSGTRRKRSEKYEEINYEVLEWVKKARAQNMQMSVKLLKEKAVEISRRRGIAGFSASNGWLERFRTRNNLNFKAAGHTPSPDSVAWKERLPVLLMSYDIKNIYNLDETGIFFRTLPTRGCALSTKNCKKGDLASERVTVALCTNAVGDKEPPLVIARPQSPLGKSSSGLSYHAHPKSWMTAVIFGKWLRAFEQKMVQQNRNILLLLNNAPCHYANIHLERVKLQYLPPLSSCPQPLDRGIVKNFKLLYQKHLVSHVAVRASGSGSVRAEEVARKVSLTDCLFWVNSAWKEIEPTTITYYFALCGITTSDFQEKVDSGIEKSLEELARVAGIELDLKNLNEPSCFDTMTESEEPPRFSGRKAEEGKEKTKEKEEEVEVSVGAIDILQKLYECRHGILKSSSFKNKEELREKLFALEQQVESEIANQWPASENFHEWSHDGMNSSENNCLSNDSSQNSVSVSKEGSNEQSHEVFRCDLCGAGFRIKHSITKHKRVVHGMHQFSCMFCKNSYPLKRNLLDHISTHKGPHGFKCEVCNKVRPNYISIQRHVKTHAQKNIPCTKCGARFKTKWELKSHEIQHKEDRQFNCEMCGLNFINPSKLREHMNRHLGDRPFKCDICGKDFNAQGNLTNHRKLHFDEKPFKCQYCSLSFFSNSARKKHVPVHEREKRKPYQCQDCNKKYTSTTSLAVHRMKFHSGGRVFHCHYCKQKFKSKGAIAEHVAEHAAERPHSCQHCLCRYKNKRELRRHQREKEHYDTQLRDNERPLPYRTTFGPLQEPVGMEVGSQFGEEEEEEEEEEDEEDEDEDEDEDENEDEDKEGDEDDWEMPEPEVCIKVADSDEGETESVLLD